MSQRKCTPKFERMNWLFVVIFVSRSYDHLNVARIEPYIENFIVYFLMGR
jgi:hypothetical protein